MSLSEQKYIDFVRSRITELRLKKDVAEHRMSLDIGKSGSYIRGITNGGSLPSLKELFNIIDYFEITPSEFFAPLESDDSAYAKICDKLRHMDDAGLEKVNTFVEWMSK